MYQTWINFLHAPLTIVRLFYIGLVPTAISFACRVGIIYLLREKKPDAPPTTPLRDPDSLYDEVMGTLEEQRRGVKP